MDRKKYRYTVALQAQTGEVIEKVVETFWSPAYEGIKEAVGSCAASMAWYESGKKVEFQPLAVTFPST